jgi:hypothetical protein
MLYYLLGKRSVNHDSLGGNAVISYRDAFMSHAHVDNALCVDYAARLRAKGIDVWLDLTDIQQGHFLSAEIQAQIDHRSTFILMMTAASLNSFWVEMERGAFMGRMAQDRSLLILPVRLEPIPVPSLLNAFLWIDAVGKPRDQVAEEIARALQMQPTYSPPPPTWAARPAYAAPMPAGYVAPTSMAAPIYPPGKNITKKSTVRALALMSVGVSILYILLYVTTGQFNDDKTIFDIEFFLVVVAIITSLLAWVGALVRTSQIKRWGWFLTGLFVGVLGLSFFIGPTLGALIWSLAGPDAPA